MERAKYNRHSRARMAETAKDGARHATPGAAWPRRFFILLLRSALSELPELRYCPSSLTNVLIKQR